MLQIRMKDVRSILVYMDPFYVFRVHVACDMIPFLNNKDTFPYFFASYAKTAPNKPAPTIR